MLWITQCCRETVSCCYFIPPSPEKKAMACYKLGFEEFIIMNKMFVQISVLLNNLMCYVVVFYVQESICIN